MQKESNMLAITTPTRFPARAAGPVPRPDWRETFARAAVALVWLYHGAWNKLLGQSPHQATIIHSVPGLSGLWSHALLIAIGATEVAIALWVLAGKAPRLAAVIQTILLIAMNAGGLLCGGHSIAKPGAMVVQNLAFIALIWLLARQKEPHHDHL
jgi:uncharacterized membrane protein YphA (DoxX/SURF4 family)